MNYIKEINWFYDWLTENSVSANAQALWHVLMAYDNKFGWKKEFTIRNTTLIDVLGISRQELSRIRNVLIQKQRITYEKSTGSNCGIYRIISFVSQELDNSVTPTDTPSVRYTLHDVDTLDKLDKTKLNYKKDTNVPQKVFIKPSLEDVTVYCNERKNTIDPQYWYDNYESNGWMVGTSPMKDWKASIRKWEKNKFNIQKTNITSNPALNYPMRDGEKSKPFDDKKLYSKF